MIPFDILRAEAARHPYPLLFATLSGAHLYGFPSPNSDFDLRGVHLLPAAEMLGLLPKRETIEVEGIREGIELDLVTHDASKFFTLLLKPNGYVLEQLFSPLIVVARPEHDELKSIARRCITRRHYHHYKGFAHTQWQLFEKEDPPRVKPLLYTYRVLMTGIHLLRTGELNANLVELNNEFRNPNVPELLARKTQGEESSVLDAEAPGRYRADFEALLAELEGAFATCRLPETADAREDLSDLLVRLRH